MLSPPRPENKTKLRTKLYSKLALRNVACVPLNWVKSSNTSKEVTVSKCRWKVKSQYQSSYVPPKRFGANDQLPSSRNHIDIFQYSEYVPPKLQQDTSECKGPRRQINEESAWRTYPIRIRKKHRLNFTQNKIHVNQMRWTWQLETKAGKLTWIYYARRTTDSKELRWVNLMQSVCLIPILPNKLDSETTQYVAYPIRTKERERDSTVRDEKATSKNWERYLHERRNHAMHDRSLVVQRLSRLPDSFLSCT